MSEMEDLKKNAELSKAAQMAKELGEYLGELSRNIDETEKRYRDSNIIWFVSWFAWLISSFFDVRVHYGFLLIFVIVFSYTSFRHTRLVKAVSEFEGAMRVLQILGHIEMRDFGDHTKKKIFEEGISLVKKWFTEKKEAQEKVYAPA